MCPFEFLAFLILWRMQAVREDAKKAEKMAYLKRFLVAVYPPPLLGESNSMGAKA